MFCKNVDRNVKDLLEAWEIGYLVNINTKSVQILVWYLCVCVSKDKSNLGEYYYAKLGSSIIWQSSFCVKSTGAVNRQCL